MTTTIEYRSIQAVSKTYPMLKDVNILIVDDDQVDVRAIKRGLEKQKIVNPVYTAKDGLEALEILRGQNGHEKLPRPYLILLDLNMPRMNGLEFLQALRDDPEITDSIVFVLTTSSNEEDQAGAYKEHIAGYLLKSEAGDNFLKVVKMIEAFVVVVRFPAEHG